MNTVRELLEGKGAVYAISGDDTIRDAILKMNQHHIGALVVTDDKLDLCGILTERDVLKHVLDAQDRLDRVCVREWMTPRVVTCTPRTTITEVQRLMHAHHIRHLAVVDEANQALNVISIQDVNYYMARDREHEVERLTETLYGPG